MTVTVGNNNPPVANADTALVVESGVAPGNTAFAGTPAASGNVLANDTDADALDTKTVSAVAGLAGNVGAPLTTTYGTVRINADGSYTYTLDNTRAATQALAQGQSVTETFSYTVKDTAGATSTTTLTITVTGTNDAPVAVADSAATPLNVALLNINVKANDTDVDNSAAQLTVSAPALANPAQGAVTLNADGTLNFTPALGVTGPVLITYTLTDAFGASSTGTLTVTVTADFMDQRISIERSDAASYMGTGNVATYRGTTNILPVHAEPALFVLQSVSDLRNEISLRSGLGHFQADSVTQAELLGSLDADNIFAGGAEEGPGGLIGRDFSPLRPLYRNPQDQPNALYVQHSVRHEPLSMDSGLHVQNAVRASQLESAARNARVNSFNSATTGFETLVDPFALGAPLLFQKALAPGEADRAKTAANSAMPQDSQESRAVDASPGYSAPVRPGDAGFFVPMPRHRAAPGFSSQLHRVAAEMRPHAAKIPLLEKTR